jgi:hypothetical protein
VVSKCTLSFYYGLVRLRNWLKKGDKNGIFGPKP